MVSLKQLAMEKKSMRQRAIGEYLTGLNVPMPRGVSRTLIKSETTRLRNRIKQRRLKKALLAVRQKRKNYTSKKKHIRKGVILKNKRDKPPYSSMGPPNKSYHWYRKGNMMYQRKNPSRKKRKRK